MVDNDEGSNIDNIGGRYIRDGNIDTFNAQELITTLSTFTRVRMSGHQSYLLYLIVLK